MAGTGEEEPDWDSVFTPGEEKQSKFQSAIAEQKARREKYWNKSGGN